MKLTSFCAIAAIAQLSWACLLPEERDGSPRVVRRQGSNGLAIGTGDRYSAGTIAPRGLGTQTTTLTSILNVKEILSGLKGLATVYGIKTFTTPYTTVGGATISGGIAGGTGTCNNAVRVYLSKEHLSILILVEGLVYVTCLVPIWKIKIGIRSYLGNLSSIE